jgi:alkanesulfonate monooxygenase SsuD/methylene tetrahydromethanopterin reductase-like flavin-dependent oxidoreductase (luciferase family)
MPESSCGLEFAVFITPSADAVDRTVQLAILSETVGFDVVAVQDHPYQDRFLDCWTLLTWIAARTQRVRVMSSVLNLAIRSPAMVAKDAASLERLSGGRLELGLGGGYFWDRIAAMAPRRTRGQAVDAFAEALEIIRGVWDVDQPEQLTVDGAYHRVDGLDRGPAPARRIPVWVGADKPRMIAIAAAEADGVVISGVRSPGASMRDVNQQIDAAAVVAGRDPASIRRSFGIRGEFSDHSRGFLQGPPEQWVEQLYSLVVEDGITTPMLVADDAHTIERFADEVMPALKEAVARAGASRPASSSFHPEDL